MTIELVTGRGSTDHVGAEDFGAYQAYTYGPDAYILHGCEATVVDSNTVRISEGELLVQGRHIRVKGSEDIAIQSGSVGRNRKDLICVRYAKDQNGIEDAPLAAIVGAPVEGTASYPSHVEGNILSGEVAADFPLYGISVSGLAVGDPVLLMERSADLIELLGEKADKDHTHTAASIGAASASHSHNTANITSGTLPVARGGTGVTSDAAIALKSWPVGSVYLSFSSTSPASIFGGSWTQLSGRFLRAANDTGTGGSDTHTLAESEMPSHRHTYKMSFGTPSSGDGSGPQSGTSANATAYTTYAGGGQAHNNMPAYQDVYAWRRTA